MHELWDASRSFAVWVYLGALLLPVLVGALWWGRQVRGGSGAERELTRHELAYLKGGPREVVLAAVQRLVRAGVLSVSGRGLVHAIVPGRRQDRIDGVIVANAEHVFPKVFLKPLRSALRGLARALETDGLLVPRCEVAQRWKAVILLQVGVFLVGVALFVVALALHEQPWLELLFAVCAAVAVAIGLKESGRSGWVPTRGGMGALTAAGVVRPRPRSGLRRAVALVALFALLTRTSTPGTARRGRPVRRPRRGLPGRVDRRLVRLVRWRRRRVRRLRGRRRWRRWWWGRRRR
jgi:uncharacterized protein (TIGR04222 family)